MMQSEIVNRYLAGHAKAAKVQLVGPLASSGAVWTEPVLFIDGGAGWRTSGEGIAVGDRDSFDGPLDHQLDPDKAFSDLAFALGHIGPEFTQIELSGFLGGRRDHELLNFGEVFHFLDRRTAPARVSFDREVEAFSTGHWEFASHGTFSLVLFAPCQVTLRGDCRYHIASDMAVTPLSSFGLSNVGSGQVQLQTNGPVFIFHDLHEAS